MSPTLYLLAAILIFGGKLNNFNIKNHPLDIRVRRDVRTSINNNEPASKELDAKGKLSTIVDYQSVKKLHNAILRIHVENNSEELSDILKAEELNTNQKLSSDRDERQKINVISVNPEEFSDIVGADEINTYKKLYSYRDADPAGKFNNINSKEFSGNIDDNKDETAVHNSRIGTIKEDGIEKEIKQYERSGSKSATSVPIKIIHQNIEEETGKVLSSIFKSLSRKYTKRDITRKKRDMNNKAFYNQQTDGRQRPNNCSGVSTQNGPYTNHTVIRKAITNIMSLYARLPYQKIANTFSHNRTNYTKAGHTNRTYHNGPKSIPHNQSQATYRVPLAPNSTRGNINRGNSMNHGFSQNSHNTYNQSQPSNRVPLAPYNTNQGRVYNGNITNNGLNKTGYESTNHHITPVPFSPYQGSEYNSKPANDNYPLNNPLHNNSAGYTPADTIGYQVPPSTTTETTTPLIVESCILCVSHGCPSLFRKVGFLCLPTKQKSGR